MNSMLAGSTTSTSSVGVVGAGLMGRWHADAFARTGEKVAAVVDSDQDRARGLGSNYGAACFDSLKDVVTRAVVGSGDIAAICAPLADHASLIRTALEADLHVLAEKPLAEDAAATRELLELAELGAGS